MSVLQAKDSSLLQVSERFCADDSDITLQSSDGILFKVHRKNLEVHSEGFAAADSISGTGPESKSEIVLLSETSTTLDLLLQYMYRQPQPDLQQVDFDTLAGVAEAAEKYQVYAAISICRIFMNLAVPQHPVEVLSYATKHGYQRIMDHAAPRTISMDIGDVVASLHSCAVIPWCRYYEAFYKVLRTLCQDARWRDVSHRRDAVSQTQSASSFGQSGFGSSGFGSSTFGPRQSVLQQCSKKAEISIIILQQLGNGPKALMTLDQVLNISVQCQDCQDDIARYRTQIEDKIKQIPQYSTFL